MSEIRMRAAMIAAVFVLTAGLAGCDGTDSTKDGSTSSVSSSASKTSFNRVPTIEELEKIANSANMVVIDDLRGMTLQEAAAKLHLPERPPAGFSPKYEYTTATGGYGNGATPAGDPGSHVVTAAIAVNGKFYFGVAPREVVESSLKLKSMVAARAPITVSDTSSEIVRTWADCRKDVNLRFGLDGVQSAVIQAVPVEK